MGALIEHREDHDYYSETYARITFARDGVDWTRLADIYARAPLAERCPAAFERAFRNSYLCCFARVDGELVGAARAISDGVVAATVLDVAVEPGFQGRGIGRRMMGALLRRLPFPKVYLATVPGKEGFYARLGFLPQTNAMGLFSGNARDHAIDRGILVA